MNYLIPPTMDDADNQLPLRVLDNVRPEIRAEVAYALALAAADTAERSTMPREAPC